MTMAGEPTGERSGWSVSLRWRVGVTVVLFLAVVAAAVILILNLLEEPATIDYTANHVSGAPVNVTMQTVGSFGSGDHPTWVSYLIESPESQWVHTTLFQVPAHARINV